MDKLLKKIYILGCNKSIKLSDFDIIIHSLSDSEVIVNQNFDIQAEANRLQKKGNLPKYLQTRKSQ